MNFEFLGLRGQKVQIWKCRKYGVWTHFYIHTPYFLHFQIWTFWPRKPKNSNFINSFLEHYPQPKMNQKIQKDPKSILILTMKLLQTHIWKTLPISDLISLGLISLTFSKSSQISPSSSNHLKSVFNENKNSCFWTSCSFSLGFFCFETTKINE